MRDAMLVWHRLSSDVMDPSMEQQGENDYILAKALEDLPTKIYSLPSIWSAVIGLDVNSVLFHLCLRQYVAAPSPGL